MNSIRNQLKYQTKDMQDPLWRAYRNMWQRCTSKHPMGQYYVGITVDPVWSDFAAFRKWSITHGWNRDLTIDRINNSAGYSPTNCRWVTRSVNMRNTRRAILLAIGGVVKPLAEWCELRCLNYQTVWQRIQRYSWTTESALELTPKSVQ